MKVLKELAVMGIVVVLAGCASVQTASRADLNGQTLTLDNKVKDVAHINASNYGLYFLKWGLITGSIDNVGYCTLFSDTVRVDKVVNVLTTKSKDLGASKTVDIQSQASTKMIPLCPFPYLFYVKEVAVSGNAVR